MLLTALAQLRFATSIMFGVRFAPWSLEQLMDALTATYSEFGALGSGDDPLGGPPLDDATRQEVQFRRFRTQAIRAAADTPYYARLFADLHLDPRELKPGDVATIPLTPKQALSDDPDAFVRRSARPVFRTTTTGTTGRPTSIAFAQHELQTFVALAAIGLLQRRTVTAEDIVVLGSSARATLGNTCFGGACARIGAQVTLAGLLPPTEMLALLREQRGIAGKHDRASVLSTYPSYLGMLVTQARAESTRPGDFGLHRIFVGGELVSAGLKARAEEVFGPVAWEEGFGMTEPWPFGGMRCEQGHLHFDVSQGLLETQPLADGDDAATLVLTPFPPYRDTTLLLRYHTEDVVRRVPADLTCRMRAIPATSQLQGKLRLAVRHARGWTFPRNVIEALEEVPAIPLPARFGFWSTGAGVAVEVVVPQATPALSAAIADRLVAEGVPVDELHLRSEPSELLRPFPLRGDLQETTFARNTMGVLHSALPEGVVV